MINWKKGHPEKIDDELTSKKVLVWVEYPLQEFSQSMFGNWVFYEDNWHVQGIGNPKGGYNVTHYAEINEPDN